MAAAIRGALDMLLDGQHTGRYRWDQLHKTEKTHAGTLVEIALARALGLADGTALDYTIAGADVDCKFSCRLGGWMIPPEAEGKLLLLVQASDEDGTWSAGLLRAAGENLRPAGNRDRKRALSERGRAAVRWLHDRAPLQENALIRLPERDVAAIFALPSGQQRVNELFRRAQRMRVSRTVVATVAMQDDYMKRVRGGGGARDQLHAEGIVIFGDYAGDQVLASALGLPRPGPGEFVSARLARRFGGRPSPAQVSPAAALGAGTTPVPSVSRAPTGCSPRPPMHPGPHPRCPAIAAPVVPADPQVKSRATRRKRLHRQPQTGIVWRVRKHSRRRNCKRGTGRGRRAAVAAPGQDSLTNRRRNMRGFRNFVLRGDVIIIAVGLVIALAFSALILAFTNDIILPIVARLQGGKSIGLGIQLGQPGNPKTFMDIGAFISAVIYFVIFMAIIYFVIIVPYKHVQARRGQVVFGDPAPVKTCPACLSSDLPAAASKCKYCGTEQPVTA